MKFAEDHNSARYRITGYEDEGVGINGRIFNQSLVLSPMEIITDWAPQSILELKADHLDSLYEMKPEVLILATGPTQVFPNKEVLRRLAKEQIGYEIMSTQSACRTFNIIMSEDRNVVIGFVGSPRA